MESAIPAGSQIRIRCDREEAEPGQVVAFVTSLETLTIHRVWYRGRSARARAYIVTQGDANPFCDPPVLLGNVLGIATEWKSVDDERWRTIESADASRAGRGVLAAVVRRILCTALEAHPALATLVIRVIAAVRAPLVWLHPYPADAVRLTSVPATRDIRSGRNSAG